MEHTPGEAALIEREKGLELREGAAGMLFLEIRLIFASYCTLFLYDCSAISGLNPVESRTSTVQSLSGHFRLHNSRPASPPSVLILSLFSMLARLL